MATDLQEVEQVQILRVVFYSAGKFQEVMSNTDMTVDQQVEALRAEGLEVDTQLSEDMKIVVSLLSGMNIVAMMMIQLRIDLPTDHA